MTAPQGNLVLRRHEVLVVRRTAEEAARSAGAISRSRFGSEHAVDAMLDHDVKLDVDRACETAALDVIRARFPTDAILSEECGYEMGRGDRVWIVDPLDGTVNFHHGLPLFCASVACYEIGDGAERGVPRLPDGRALGEPVAAAVYDPLRDEMFTGTAGRGAFLNQLPLTELAPRSLSEVVIAVSFSAREESLAVLGRSIPTLTLAAQKVRSLGCTALELAQVAAGRLGGFLQIGTNLWDFAGGAAIVRAAGGRFEARPCDHGRWRVTAGAPGVFEELCRAAQS
ncbi:MAG TPA: inositol monophosphatase [Spirochaetia bacterium]